MKGFDVRLRHPRVARMGVLMLALLGGTTQLEAQGPVVVEIRGMGAHPTGEWTDDRDVETGWGYGAALHLRMTRNSGFYGGWDRFSFEIDDDASTGGNDPQGTDEGFRLGLEAGTSLRRDLIPFLFAGLFYGESSLAIGEEESFLTFKSDRSLGYEVGGGVGFRMGAMLVRPNLMYRSHETDFDVFGDLTDYDVNVSYLAFGIGIATISR